MKLNYNQIVNYIKIRNYLNEQCRENDNDYFKVKAHFRSKDNKDYLIISFNKEYDAGFAMLRENNYNSGLITYSIKELFENEAIIVKNSPEVKRYIEFLF